MASVTKSVGPALVSSRVIPVIPYLMLCVVESALELVSPVSVCCDWA